MASLDTCSSCSSLFRSFDLFFGVFIGVVGVVVVGYFSTFTISFTSSLHTQNLLHFNLLTNTNSSVELIVCINMRIPRTPHKTHLTISLPLFFDYFFLNKTLANNSKTLN